MKLHSHILELAASADPDRVQRALTEALKVEIVDTNFGVITASVHSKNNQSYGVMLASHRLSCSCRDHYYRGVWGAGDGKGYVCKHVLTTIFYLQERESLQENHFTHKVI